VNQIGRPVSDPHLVDIRLSCANRIEDRQCREHIHFCEFAERVQLGFEAAARV
jgi:hypothetical protein